MDSLDELFALKLVPIAEREPSRITTVSNRTSIAEPIWHVLNSAKVKFKNKAYLHWYSKFGIE